MSLDPSDFFRPRKAHFSQFFGPLTEPIMHSTDLKVPHVDVYQFRPTKDRGYWTLITGGMSNFPQPGALGNLAPRAEIMLYAAEPAGWMFNVLKGLAEMHFDDETFLHWWHRVPNGMPMTAKPSLLTNFFFLPPYFEPKEFDRLTIEGDAVDILWMVPITDAELNFKLEHGAKALEQLFADHRMSPVIDESRPSLV